MNERTPNFTSIWIVIAAVSSRSGESLQPIAIAALDLVFDRILEFGVPRLRALRRRKRLMNALGGRLAVSA